MKFIILKLIYIYQKFISPFLRPSCRFHPTCSEYCKTSLETFGLIKGLLLAIRRILKCHPLGDSGYDPVPRNRENGLH